MEPRPATLTWRPALDGLRGLAVVAVVLYHFKTRPLLPGGLFGVDVFFVLSGFLITALLLHEWRERGAISLPHFYARRALRILPAFAAFLLIYTTIAVAFQDRAIAGRLSGGEVLENAAFALTNLYSWGVALDKVTPGGFNHLWSLAVEEQYYLVWPPLLAGLLRSGVRVPTVLVLASSLVFLSASLPLLLGDPGWLRVYFGADYRAHALLIGSFAGLLYASGYLDVSHVKTGCYRLALVLATAYLVGVMLLVSDGDIHAYYVPGFPLLALAAAVVVVAAAGVERGVWLTLLGNRLLTYLGKRSYAIYIWHFPVGEALTSYDAPVQFIAGGAITLLAAELSYRLVERPALRLKNRLPRQRTEPAPAAPALTAAAEAV